MSLYYCEKCDKRVASRIGVHKETYTVRGDPTEVVAQVRICEICSGYCSDNELDDKTLLEVYDKYRDKHGIISRSGIESLLDKYDISQRSLAALLKWGEITIHRYVAGNIPDEAHNQILQFISEPANMAMIFKQNKDRIPPGAQKKIETRLYEILGQAQVKSSFRIQSPQEDFQVSIFTGDRRFSGEALENMILYFASQTGGVLKTKLMKLLWFTDFTHYSHHATSISGTTYVHLPHGPAPDDYEHYLSAMKLNNDISIDETIVGDLPGYTIEAKKSPDFACLPSTAKSVMEAVQNHFENHSSGEISEVSHAEPAYTETRKSKPISYEYANRMKVKIKV